MSLRDQLKGTGVALVTPFKEDNSIDFDSYSKLVDFVIEGGVNYVVTLGTTGETPTLSKEEKLELIDATFSIVSGRVPVVIGSGGNNTAAVVKEINSFPVDKAAAILSASPYYNKPSQEGIFQHYKALASATTRPIMLYNVPGRTGSNITAATTLRLASEFSNISGIKEASGNMNQCMQILRDKPQDFLVVSGDDNLALAQMACGMTGVISVAANCFPKDFSAMVNYALQDDYHSARQLNHILLEGYDSVVLLNDNLQEVYDSVVLLNDNRPARQLNHILLEGYELLFAENNPAGVKAFLAELGIIRNQLRLPLVPLSEPIVKQVKSYLATLK